MPRSRPHQKETLNPYQKIIF